MTLEDERQWQQLAWSTRRKRKPAWRQRAERKKRERKKKSR